MYTKVPLNGIRNALGQEAFHFCNILIIVYFTGVYQYYTVFNFALLLMHVFTYFAIYVQYTHEVFSMHTRQAVQMIAALFVIIMMAYCSDLIYLNPDLLKYYESNATISGLSVVIDLFQIRLELFCFISILISTMLFLAFTSLNDSTSFVLSEFDYLRLRRNVDLFKTDALELRFREINMFNGIAAPFFVTLFVIVGDRFTIDPLYGNLWWVLYVTGGQLLTGSIFMFFDLRKKTSWFKTRKFIYVFALFCTCFVWPIITWF